jgi:hypothetical protein
MRRVGVNTFQAGRAQGQSRILPATDRRRGTRLGSAARNGWFDDNASKTSTAQHTLLGHSMTAPNNRGGEVSLTNLRGAGVSADFRRAGRLLVGLLLIGTLATAVALAVAGFHKNDQITKLHRYGVPVTITVSGCLGSLGGSGSNAAGYSCRGNITLDGRRYSEAVPGNSLYSPGTPLQAVVVPGDPALLTTASALKAEHTSWTVFVPSVVLLAVLVVLSGGILIKRRRLRIASPTSIATKVS